MIKRVLLFSIFYSILFSNSLAQNNISFLEEYIDFKLDNEYFYINGIFYINNNSKEIISQHIIFPFATSSHNIDSIKVLNLKTLKNIHYSILNNGISFDLTLFPMDTLDINIFYRQKSSKKNTYIVSTIKSWNSPLKVGKYTLTTQKDFKINTFSIIPDSIITNGNDMVYFWNKHNFIPEKEFDFEIDKKK